jgi:cytochrome c-type biogenesis protein CcmH/NrfG
MGSVLVKLGRTEEGISHYVEAARLAPEDPRPHAALAKALLLQGKSSEAIPQFKEALRLDPEDVRSLTFLAWVLASDENPALRNGAEAVSLAERANAMTGQADPFVLDTLAMAYAETGGFKDAEHTLQTALEKPDPDQSHVAAMKERLRLYQSGQPFRYVFSKAITNAGW